MLADVPPPNSHTLSYRWLQWRPLQHQARQLAHRSDTCTHCWTMRAVVHYHYPTRIQMLASAQLHRRPNAQRTSRQPSGKYTDAQADTYGCRSLRRGSGSHELFSGGVRPAAVQITMGKASFPCFCLFLATCTCALSLVHCTVCSGLAWLWTSSSYESGLSPPPPNSALEQLRDTRVQPRQGEVRTNMGLSAWWQTHAECFTQDRNISSATGMGKQKHTPPARGMQAQECCRVCRI